MATSADLGKALEKFVTKLVTTGRYHSRATCCARAFGLFRSAKQDSQPWMPQLHGAWPTPIGVDSNQLPKCLTFWKRSSRQRQIDGDRFRFG